MTTSEGTCNFCKVVKGKRAMANHLERCTKRKAVLEEIQTQKKERIFHLRVEGLYHKDYWINLEMLASADLKELDSFLRNTWVECCDHLSAFTIGEKRYAVDYNEGFDYSSMNKPLGKLVAPKMKFFYKYDFGSTTELSLSVLSERKGEMKITPIQVLARNNPPIINCGLCQKTATKLCTTCSWKESGWLCENCTKKHSCEHERFLPVVNSPRVGICGYTGPTY